MYSSNDWLCKFSLVSGTIKIRTPKTWHTSCPMRNRCFPSRKVLVSRREPTGTPTAKGSSSTVKPGKIALPLTSWTWIQRLLPLVVHNIDKSHHECYMPIHQTVRPMKLVSRQVPLHLCLPLVPLTAKCVMIQATQHQFAPYWHKTPSYSLISFVLRICTSWLEKELPATGTQAGTTASVISVTVDAKLYLHQTGIPRCHRHKYILLRSRNTETTEQRGQRTSVLNQPTRPEPVRQAPSALLAVPS